MVHGPGPDVGALAIGIFIFSLKKKKQPLRGAGAEQLVVPGLSIYVGVSLQRRANEPLVSVDGGAAAMLPGYRTAPPEEIIFSFTSRKKMQ